MKTTSNRHRSPLAEAMVRLRRRKLAMVCLVIICLYFIVALMDFVPTGKASINTTNNATLIDLLLEKPLEESYSAPCSRDPELKGFHLLGTDINGKDLLWKTTKSMNTAVVIGVLTCLIAYPIAVFMGMVAGYFGGILDDIIQYAYQTLANIPELLLLIGLMMALGKSVTNLCIALGLTTWVGTCRLLRGETMKHREREYVLAAKAIGAGPIRIIFRHILPNIAHLIIIGISLRFGGLILSESILSYLGVGVGAGRQSWGTMISDSRMELIREPLVWWNLAGASFFLLILVLAWNLFADALRDCLDPKLRIQ